MKRLNLICEGMRAAPEPERQHRRGDARSARSSCASTSTARSWRGRELDLTLTEFKIVALLALRAGEDVGYREIYDLVHGKDFVAGYGAEGYRANVRTFIKRIRKKFRDVDGEFDHIHNYAGFGYRWIAGERLSAPHRRRAPRPRRRPRFYRSLAAKVAVLALIFLAVPVIVYDRFRAADEAQKALLLRSVREQGRVMAAGAGAAAGRSRASRPAATRPRARAVRRRLHQRQAAVLAGRPAGLLLCRLVARRVERAARRPSATS